MNYVTFVSFEKSIVFNKNFNMLKLIYLQSKIENYYMVFRNK